MAKSGKSLSELIREVYDVVGAFALERYDLHIDDENKVRVVDAMKNGLYTSFGPYKVTGTEDLDGYKFHLGENTWVMARASGTEPVLRIYAEASTYEEAVNILNATQATLFEKTEA